MADEPERWATAALVLKIVSRTITPDEISERMGQPNWLRTPSRFEQAHTKWSAHPVDDDHVPLREQLDATEQFITEKLHVLQELASECEITLRLGWSQVPEGDAEETGVVIKPSLVSLLHRVGGSVIIRVYNADGDDA